MKRIAWGGGCILVFCVLCMMLTGDAADQEATTGTKDAPAEAPVAADDAEPTEAPAFVSANWKIEEPAPESPVEASIGLPDDGPPAWTKKFKGTAVAHFDGKKKKGK